MTRSLSAALGRGGGLSCVVAVILALAPSVGATTLTPRSMAELVAEADTIVIGHARGAESLWVGRNLYTRYRIEVQETLLGAPTHEVMVIVEGGVDMNRKHPISMSVADAPVLQRDEHLALLLKRGGVLGDAAYGIVGFNQGRISLEPPAGQPSATRADVAADYATRTRQLGQLRTKLQQLIATRDQSAAEAKARSSQSAPTPARQPSAGGGVKPGR